MWVSQLSHDGVISIRGHGLGPQQPEEEPTKTFREAAAAPEHKAKALKPNQHSNKGQHIHVSYSLNSLKGGYIGDYIGDYYRGY